MNRKRFVKKLMGTFGHDRNLAKAIAGLWRVQGYSYDAAWDIICKKVREVMCEQRKEA